MSWILMPLTPECDLLPLVVDLDGTLIQTDMLHEGALAFLGAKPLQIFEIPFHLLKGRANVKRYLSKAVPSDVTLLPYNQAFLSWLKEQKSTGRTLVLCTASDRVVAEAIAAHLGIFDLVFASDGEVNLAGDRKAEVLEETFGLRGFDYAGNSRVDLKVWARANQAIVVNASASVQRALPPGRIEKVFPPSPVGWAAWADLLHVNCWLENLLLLVPVFAAHAWGRDADLWLLLTIAVLAFSLCASSVYLTNDLLELESARRHPRKRSRPLAAGRFPLWKGVLMAPFMFAASIAMGAWVGKIFLIWLVAYFFLACVCLWFLKRWMLVECFTSALSYTTRIMAGAAVVEELPAVWLVSFSMLLFVSLAFAKRYAGLDAQQKNANANANARAHGRAYDTTDARMIMVLGITSGLSAVVVLAWYLASDYGSHSHVLPESVWLSVPIVMFWISWIWLQTHRNRMHDEPFVFAVKDRASLAAGLAFIMALAVGATGLPW